MWKAKNRMTDARSQTNIRKTAIELTEEQLLSKEFVHQLTKYLKAYTNMGDDSDTSTDFETRGNQLKDLVSSIQKLLAKDYQLESQIGQDNADDKAGSEDLTQLKEQLQQLLNETQTIEKLDSKIEMVAKNFANLQGELSVKAGVVTAIKERVPNESKKYEDERDQIKLKMTSTKSYWSYLMFVNEFLNVVLKLQANMDLINKVEVELSSKTIESPPSSATPLASPRAEQKQPNPPSSNQETPKNSSESQSPPPLQIDTPNDPPAA